MMMRSLSLARSGRPPVTFACVALLAVLFGALPGAAAAQLRRFPIPNHGALELQVPDGWVGEASGGTPSAPPTIQFSAPGREFAVLVTALWAPQGEATALKPERLRAAIEKQAASPEISERSEEATRPVQELHGPQANGYYFSATDKTWKPSSGDYRHITQGEALVGTLVVTFTILSNAPAPDRDAALEMLRSARHATP
jgi:hypothetical protein